MEQLMYAINGKQVGLKIVGVKVLAALAMIASLPACESGGTLAGWRESGAAPISSRSVLPGVNPPGWLEPGEAIIRQRNDPARGRLWVLTKEGVDVYDSLQKRKLAHIGIPGWVWVDEPYACAPNLALGPKGEVVITSNVMPTLWRVDPESLAITRHEIAMEPASGKDFGFTSLAYSRSLGAYYGVAAFDGSVWRIDAQLESARDPVFGVSAARACGLAG
jgi:hypothetical protein